MSDDKINSIEVKYCGQTLEVKEEMVNGVPVGIVKGYIATWDIDRGNDQFIQGAFAESLVDHREKNRPIRLKASHWHTVGGFPIDKAFEDDRGLFGEGQINLEVQKGKEAFALAKQGILSDFSIGFTVIESEMDEDTRRITKAIIWEGSLVDEPMNTAANVTEVKTSLPFKDLKIAKSGGNWDQDAALSRLREFTKSENTPGDEYKNAFILVDKKQADPFDAYQFQIADVINGEMKIIPEALFLAAEKLQEADNADLPDEDRLDAIRHIERYYAKMNIASPFSSDEKQYFVSDDVKAWTARDIEKYLKSAGGMSKSAAKILASRIDNGKIDTKKIDKDNNMDYKGISNVLKKPVLSFKDVLSELKKIQ